jgi:NAD(P)-dependent dehydrogenase (short-subunit alcohol dehydrogenase family)
MPLYIVTGANRGIGLEFVRQLVTTPNAAVIATIRSSSTDDSDLRQFHASLTNGSSLHVLHCDTSSPESIASFASSAIPLVKSSGGKVDLLINNAGINATSSDNALTFLDDPSSLTKHTKTNVLGPMSIAKHFLPYLSQGSVVLNLTSGLGSLGRGIVKCTTYAISKASLNMASVHLAGHEDVVRQGVRVLVCDPGWVKTRMGGPEAMIEAEVSVKGMLNVVRKASKGEDGVEVGKCKFYLYDGSDVQW